MQPNFDRFLQHGGRIKEDSLDRSVIAPDHQPNELCQLRTQNREEGTCLDAMSAGGGLILTRHVGVKKVQGVVLDMIDFVRLRINATTRDSSNYDLRQCNTRQRTENLLWDIHEYHMLHVHTGCYLYELLKLTAGPVCQCTCLFDGPRETFWQNSCML